MRHTIVFASAPLILTTFLLAACAGDSTRSEPRRLLLAYDGPVSQAPHTPRPRLVVRAVSVPDYLDRRELVRRVGVAEILVEEGVIWAERPAKAITRWVSLALSAQRSDYAVEAYSTADGRAPDAVLAITLESIEPVADGSVRLRGSWVYAPSGKTATQSGRFDADAQTRDATPEASVAALQKALHSAVNTLAAELPAAGPVNRP